MLDDRYDAVIPRSGIRTPGLAPDGLAREELEMKRTGLALAAAAVVTMFSSPAHADGRMIHFTLDLGAAVPFGPGLKETTFKQFPDWAQSCNLESIPPGYNGYLAICNPAMAGFDAGLAFHYEMPFHLGIGAGYKMTIFGRATDPLYPGTEEPNKGDKSPFISHQMNLLIKLRILDMVRHFGSGKQMGSLDLDITIGYVRLYGTEDFFQIGQNLAYMYPVAKAFSIGVYMGFVEAIALDKRRLLGTQEWDGGGGSFEIFEGNLNDVWMQMGLRMAFSFVEHGAKKDKDDEGGEFGEGESDYAEKMKLLDSDGDGLSDYAEMMLGTSSTSKDTDSDTIPDGIEDANLNGARDSGETDPAKADTDDGGCSDGWEMANGYDPMNFEDDDRDVDGVVDEKDVCPGTPAGTPVGTSGCPTLTESVVLDQVTFVEGTSELNPEAYVQLDQYAMILLQDQTMEVVILVFGPPSGSKTKIQALTIEQATVIKDYLVLRGIDEARVVVSGEGKSPDGPRVELQPIIPMW